MKSEYDYDLPSELIAHRPANPRDSAKLLVYKVANNEIIEDVFANISKYIPEKSLLILNDTRVAPARLILKKKTSGSVKILFLLNEIGGFGRTSFIKGLPDKKLKIGDLLFIEDKARPDEGVGVELKPLVKIVSQDKEEFTFELLVSPKEFETILFGHGRTPLPPYINSPLEEGEVRSRYQTIFAKNSIFAQNLGRNDNEVFSGTQPSPSSQIISSVAAPTASLHFTDKVFSSLTEKGIKRSFLTLHVGRGTFSPAITSAKELHGEPVSILANSIKDIIEAKKEGRTIVAAGTTAVRALETAADFIETSAKTNNLATDFSVTTKIFIKPPYDFKIVSSIITNFHLPNTSLLMLLDAFLKFRGAKRGWRELYEYAIKNKFRFYSFGDVMIVI